MGDVTPAALVAAISRHLDAVELRVRKEGPLRDYDLAAMRVQLEAAQAKLAGVLEVVAAR